TAGGPATGSHVNRYRRPRRPGRSGPDPARLGGRGVDPHARSCACAILVHVHAHQGAVPLRLANARDLGGFVRERRRGFGLTQAQLATRASVSRRWLSDLESGKESADFGLVLKTLHALGLVLLAVPEKEAAPIDLDEHLAQYRNREGR